MKAPEEIKKPEAAKADKKKSNKTLRLRSGQALSNVCGSEMKIIAIITEPVAVICILRYLEKNKLPVNARVKSCDRIDTRTSCPSPNDQPSVNSPPGKISLSA